MNNQGLNDFFTYNELLPQGTTDYYEIELALYESETVFLIQANQFQLNLIPKTKIPIEFRSSSILLDETLTIPLMVQIDGNPVLTYGGLLNYHQSVDFKRHFTSLATQEAIRLLFFDEYGQLANIIKVSNHLRIGFFDYLRQLKNRLPWSQEDFETAKSKMLLLYPTTLSLWHAVKKMAER